MSYEVLNDRSDLPESGFSIVANSLARDGRLKRISRALMIEIMSHAENFVVTEAYLVKSGREGRDAIRGALHELEEFGYLERVRIREAGKFGGVRYRPIRRNPGVATPPPENPSVVDHHGRETSAGKPVPENPTLKKTKEEHQKEESHLASLGASSPQPDPVIEELCNLLAGWIEKNTGKRPKIPQQWRVDCRRMIEIDERTPKQVRGAIEWSQKDPFWCANILSMRKLREKYDTLALQAASGRGTGGGGGGRASTKERVAGGVTLVQKFEALERANSGQLELGASL